MAGQFIGRLGAGQPTHYANPFFLEPTHERGQFMRRLVPQRRWTGIKDFISGSYSDPDAKHPSNLWLTRVLTRGEVSLRYD